MTNIKVLPPEVSAKIAAGEVIERPAYAIKELIENSLDAKAKHIYIKVFDAGLKKIVVTDDGEGMSKKNVLLAYLPHTTSKISTEEDLYSVKSFGFRGEALASIASISTLTIQSRQKKDVAGYQVIIKKWKTFKTKLCWHAIWH